MNTTPEAGNDSSSYLAYKVIIQNSSTVPVYDVYVLSTSNRKPDDLKRINIIPEFTKHIDTLKPGSNYLKVKTAGSSMGGVRPEIALIFRDSDSRYWFRGPHGRLVLVAEKCVYSFF